MRVLHVPFSVGGNPQGLARAERELGLESLSIAFGQNDFGYPVDELLAREDDRFRRLSFERRRAQALWRAATSFDVIHFNFGRTLLPPALAYRDLWLLHRLGKVIAVTFQGDDARHAGIEPPWPSLQAGLPERYGAEVTRERRRRIAAFDRFAHVIWYLNPDLASALPARARFIPYAHVDPRDWMSESTRVRTPGFTVVHAPSDRRVKGTSFVESAVSGLSSEGLDIALRIVHGRGQHDVRAALADADVAVDQLFAGWYGGFAVEAMALGVPVISYIRNSDLDVLDPRMRHDLPVLSATPRSLPSVLRSVYRDADRQALADASRRYVERWHDPLAIARITSRAYARALGMRRR